MKLKLNQDSIVIWSKFLSLGSVEISKLVFVFYTPFDTDLKVDA